MHEKPYVILYLYAFNNSFRNTILSIKQFGSRTGWMFCWAWSGSKLIAKVNSSQQVIADKERLLIRCPFALLQLSQADDGSASRVIMWIDWKLILQTVCILNYCFVILLTWAIGSWWAMVIVGCPSCLIHHVLSTIALKEIS